MKHEHLRKRAALGDHDAQEALERELARCDCGPWFLRGVAMGAEECNAYAVMVVLKHQYESLSLMNALAELCMLFEFHDGPHGSGRVTSTVTMHIVDPETYESYVFFSRTPWPPASTIYVHGSHRGGVDDSER